MAELTSLRDALIEEIKDLYDAEKQLTKAMPKMAKAATSQDLRTAIETHLEETRGQMSRLEQVFDLLDERAKGKHCAGMAGIIEEGSDAMGEDAPGSVMDACIIASAQRAEHYEMAAYGTVVAWAEALDEAEVAQLLQQTLDEEKATDKKLSALAEAGINEAASAGSDEEEDDEEDEDEEEEESTTVGVPRSSSRKRS